MSNELSSTFRSFPIKDPNGGIVSVPWALISKAMAKSIHKKTIFQLAEEGGLNLVDAYINIARLTPQEQEKATPEAAYEFLISKPGVVKAADKDSDKAVVDNVATTENTETAAPAKPNPEPQPYMLLAPGIYKHYKGPLYLVINSSRDSTNNQEIINYIALYDADFFINSQMRARFQQMVNVFALPNGELISEEDLKALPPETKIHSLGTHPRFMPVFLSKAGSASVPVVAIKPHQ